MAEVKKVEVRAKKSRVNKNQGQIPRKNSGLYIYEPALKQYVIVEKDPKSHIQDIDKRKFLVPNDISVAQFMWIIRKRIQLPSEKAIFLFVGKVLPQSSASMGQVYEEHKDEDGFLYIAYSGENTFGH
ncbi:hypothetical protein FSP39_007242 [Pinctada imbricata]|uniref:Gamma-aminobutyric acid receptor-associated protein-like 2 n=1 Tax=Pinctada imbricata TaxID=66713 RepID=A0AA88XI98_PINIB|nr:hypothetical protein FSP39_007242 [Pinctada imbricata]